MNAYPCTVDAAGVDAAVEKAIGLEGSMAVPSIPIPGIGWLASIKDADGNILGGDDQRTLARSPPHGYDFEAGWPPGARALGNR